jgi:signal transduction histidine kinase
VRVTLNPRALGQMISTFSLAIIYFFYGLAFFSMGLVTSLEAGRASSSQLRSGLRYLGVFGLLHGTHEWLEIFLLLGLLPGQAQAVLGYEILRVGLLVVSFLPLSTFGLTLIIRTGRRNFYIWLVPLVQLIAWGTLVFILKKGRDPLEASYMADVLGRYLLAIPASLLAAVGLRRQCVQFHREGVAHYGYECTWAALAFLLYGAVGQLFVRKTSLPLSTFLNQDLFFERLGFPVQLLRAVAAVLIAFFILRLLRNVEREIQRQIRKLQESRIHDSQRREALRGDLLKRVVGAQEAERQRIARELHDETGQALTAVGLGLRSLEAKLRPDEEHAVDNLKKLQDLVTHSMSELQHIISDLRPSHLDDLGLRAALRWYAGIVSERTQIEINVETKGEERTLPVESKMALFRLAQEAITNVVKHAGATRVDLCLTYTNEGVSLVVIDNGCGFDLGLVQMRQDNWGLLGMHERATLLGGEFKITTETGKGTRVEVDIPYQVVEGEQNGNSVIVNR